MLTIENNYNDLKDILNDSDVYLKEPLSKYTYTKTGGPADIYITVRTVEDVKKTIEYCNDNNVPITFLGNGSNIIIRDGGIKGVVINLLELNHSKVEGNILTVGSGYPIIEASRDALEHHLTGLEFACGIPGSIGGAIYMNAGAYGGEVKDCLKEATVLDNDGNLIIMTNEDLMLNYRTSIIQEKNYVVLEAVFELAEGDYDDIKRLMDDLTLQRETKQPLEYPSCGSVFQRPPGNFAGKLIQEAGLQGKRIGGVEVSKKHAGFMVNVDNGTASDYEALIEHVQDEVKKQFGVELNREVRIIGEKL